MTVSAVEQIQPEIRAAVASIRAAIGAASDELLAAASPLPGWTRAHVAGHIAGFSHGMARQWEYALVGELIEQYTGGTGGRNAEIAALVALPPAELRAAVDAALDRLTMAMDSVTDWTLPITYRQGQALDGLAGVWRELVIHLSDLDLGIDSDRWSAAFCRHLFEFLAVRLPADTVLILDDGTRVGAGPSEIRAHGAATGVAAWLAGRRPVTALQFDPADALELGPWPSGRKD